VILKIALYWLVELKKPKYMVTDTAVELLKKLGKGGMAGFVNAFLRAFDESKVVLPKGDEGLAVKSNYPLFAVKKIKAEYGARAESILFAKSAGVTVRFERNEEKYLNLPHKETPFEKVFCFDNFTRDEGFFQGDYTFQSVGSVAIASAVEPCKEFLDACAAPGGKSVLIARKCESVTACELHEHRVGLIKAYAERMKVKNVTPMQADSSVFRPEWESAFDGVLCDVPCSGLGTLCENPDIALKEQNFASLNGAQSAILANCSRYVKKDGYLYYSTCSLLEEENDNIVEKFLRAHSEFEIEEFQSPLDHIKKKYGLQFLPDTAFGAGFYVCKLRKAK
ncbi:MAG: hypothetical protein HDP28_02915, partial [Clostridia bacterium]|nr:hypothetical protein [Clostridia bacterium]